MSGKPGIYVGKCLVNDRVYVGSSTDAVKRISRHKGDLKLNKHRNSYLQREYNLYGVDAFEWKVVENCRSREVLFSREQAWVDRLRAAHRSYGYNLIFPIVDMSMLASTHSETQAKSWKKKGVREKRLTGLRELHKDPEWRKRRSEAMKARWADKKWRDKMTVVLNNNLAETCKRKKKDPLFKMRAHKGIVAMQVPKHLQPRKPVKR